MAFKAINKSYVSSIDMLDQREIMSELIDETNEAATLLDFYELTGRAELTSAVTYHQFANEELYGIGEVVNAVVGGGTTQLILDLTAATKDNCRIGNTVQLPSGKVGYIYDKVDDSITIESVDRTVITAVAGDKFSFFSTMSGEGASGPAPFRKGQVKYWNQVQSFDGAYEVTDIQGSTKVETKFNGSHFYMVKAQHEAFTKFQADTSFGLMFNVLSTTNFESASPDLTDKDGNPLQSTRGLNQEIDTYGEIQQLDTTGVIALTDHRDWTKTLNKLRAPNEYDLMVGGNKNIEYDDFLNALGTTPELENARYSIDGREQDFGVDKFKLYGRVYNKKVMPMLDHKNVVNFDGSAGFQDQAFYVPKGKTKTASGGSVDYCRIRYMNTFGEDSRYKEVNTGAYAPVPTSTEKKWNVTYYATMGLECVNTKFFGKWHN